MNSSLCSTCFSLQSRTTPPGAITRIVAVSCNGQASLNLRPARGFQQRHAHSKRNVSYAASDLHSESAYASPPTSGPASRPLSCLPLSTLLRSYVITTVSSIPFLLQPSLAAMTFLAHTKSPILNPDRNPVLHAILRRTFYAQFCAGESPEEVRATLSSLKDTGYEGVILGHAKEVVLSKKDAEDLDNPAESPAEVARRNTKEIETWKTNTINTIDLAERGDFVALKFTGAGRQALQHLKKTIACSAEFEQAVHEMCQRAQKKQVRLLFDAEQASLQQAIDNWTIYFSKIYNKEQALIYGTYQAYSKRAPKILGQHLEIARKENFALGIKLVRGAYINSDPRDLFWPSIAETHECYNNIAKAVIQRRYGGVLQRVEDAPPAFPRVALVLATHNAESVKLAGLIRDAQPEDQRIDLAYGQLMGMADNVSCEVVQTAKRREGRGHTNKDIPKAYKYLVWGRMGECMKYLLRRAHENKDAVSRTIEARRALGAELGSRIAFWR